MMKNDIIRTAAISLILLFIYSCGRDGNGSPDFNKAEAEKEVWKAVEKRFVSWKDNDYDAHMAVYHPEWRRWSLSTRQLMKKEDFINLWDTMKNNEQVISMELEPEEIQFFGDGSFALAHFITTETFLWTGNSKTDDQGRVFERGSVHTVKMRWSDVMVKEEGRWLCAGGHRDFSFLREAEE
jgi:hypothetical protein